ncbi:uncharacterized protein LOC107622351 isoform X2 [Arachis ipaensis]|uniref:uncharacterized protein LOC107622351 isoform X2 n=1 Tax=Arachis ipaensis TaxID=130454 RepID=UPI0007AF3039|nr:uncharacterized protein LOC107622351 isoform X2 [Arachis ipaensis]XP_020970589.1 uncharacterized protein LOC107622351 isoform X2 [Arachis ipaensis]
MLQWRSISAFFRIKLSGGSKILRMERLNLNQKGQRFFEFDVPESSTSLSHPQMTINERELEQESGAQDHSIPADTEKNNVKK